MSAQNIVDSAKPSLMEISGRLDDGYWIVSENLFESQLKKYYNCCILIPVPARSFKFCEKEVTLRMLIGDCGKIIHLQLVTCAIFRSRHAISI